MVVGGGGLFDFRVTPNPNFMLDVHLDVEFDNLDMLSQVRSLQLSLSFALMILLN